MLDDGRDRRARNARGAAEVRARVYREIYEHGLLERQFADAVEARGSTMEERRAERARSQARAGHLMAASAARERRATGRGGRRAAGSALLWRLTQPYRAPDGALGGLAADGDGDGARAAVPREVSRWTTRIQATTGTQLYVVVAIFLAAGLANWGMTLRRDVLHGLGRRADPRRPAQPALRPPAEALARLLRAQPRRRDHQPAHERRRGDRPARHRRRHEPRAEHADADRHGDHPLRPRLAARARDAAPSSR